MTQLLLEDKNIKVEFVDLNEGYNGDYNPSDPENKKLLRFDIYTKNDDGDFSDETYASYCTNLPVDVTTEMKINALSYISDTLNHLIENEQSIKFASQLLSHINEEDIHLRIWKKQNNFNIYTRNPDPLSINDKNVIDVIAIHEYTNNNQKSYNVKLYKVNLDTELTEDSLKLIEKYKNQFKNPTSPFAMASMLVLADVLKTDVTITFYDYETLTTYLYKNYQIK